MFRCFLVSYCLLLLGLAQHGISLLLIGKREYFSEVFHESVQAAFEGVMLHRLCHFLGHLVPVVCQLYCHKFLWLISKVNFSGFCSLLTEMLFLFSGVSPHASTCHCRLQTPFTLPFDHRYSQTSCQRVFSSSI